MPNQIPVVNYIINIIEDTYYWINNSKEHIIIINEFVNEGIIKVDDEVVSNLNLIYDSYEQFIIRLDNLKEYAVNGQKQFKFFMNLCFNTLKVLQSISNNDISFIGLLSDLDKIHNKSLYLLIVSHITIEQRYSLEILSANINRITGLGFVNL
ncbi:MAG: hypothetical protein ACOWWH_11400 [Eubacteriaceae bacterium]